jgi:CheY-like chemotaxis protein
MSIQIQMKDEYMNTITIDETLNYTKDLTILYVEDDLDLQTSTKEFFEVLFNSVTVASNGQEALEYYEKKSYDLIISDIKMPLMDGIELTKKIKEINPQQCIIITSAYNDTEYLVTFLNLNIRQFLHKPIDIDNMIETLYYASKSIVNEKMVESYRKELEANNKELLKKNSELESLVRILDAKLTQIGRSTPSNKNIEYENAKISSEYLHELSEIETDISGAAVLISLSKHLSTSNIEVLGDMFISYATILLPQEAYNSLTTSINSLGDTLKNAPANFIKRVEEISILLESFIYVLRMWRKNIAADEIYKAFELHISMINDIETIIAIINNKDSEITSRMEFFND